MNQSASELGKLGKGKKKTLTKVERKRRGQRGALAWKKFNAQRKRKKAMPHGAEGV